MTQEFSQGGDIQLDYSDKTLGRIRGSVKLELMHD
jgi:hypothetical protein